MQFQFVWKSTKCGRGGGEYIYVLGCLGVVGLEKEISGIIEFGALNEWKKENKDSRGPTTDLSVCSTAMKSRSDDKLICEEGLNWFLPVWNEISEQWWFYWGRKLRLKEEKQ